MGNMPGLCRLDPFISMPLHTHDAHKVYIQSIVPSSQPLTVYLELSAAIYLNISISSLILTNSLSTICIFSVLSEAIEG